MSKSIIFSAGLIGFLLVGTISPIWAAQIDVRLSTHLESAQPTFKFLKTVFIEYPDGGELSRTLLGKDILVTLEADKSSPGVSELINKINSNLKELDSTVFVTDLTMTYRAHLVGRGDQTAIDYKVTLEPTIVNYILRQATESSPALIDAQWRGITITGPITITDAELGDVEVNTLIGFIQKEVPEAYDIISGTEAETLLNANLIDASGVLKQPLANWHHLFDPSGTISDTAKWGYQGEKVVITSFTMGESSLREGMQKEREHSAEFTTDKKYVVRTVESADSANIQIDGFVTETSIEGAEYFGSSPKVPEGYATTSTGGFPVGVMYGMAGAGAAVAVFVLVWSDRKLKKQNRQ
ncbi:MAG TPA: hypothetical protein VLB45_05130 [Nitrosopumilaceae archaeon]|nr:hypothetical protein [Nitrosopumilaceae archaeon]